MSDCCCTKPRTCCSTPESSAIPGANGWTAVFSIVDNGENGGHSFKIIDWTGGSGIKPDYPVYLTDSGTSTEIEDAAIFGEQGEQGEQGEVGPGVEAEYVDDGDDAVRGEFALALAAALALTVTLTASANPSTDRRADLLAAQATGAKYIRLGPGEFRIRTVDSPATASKASGAMGWGIASGVRVIGYGPGVTKITGESGGSYTGCILYPAGMETATVAYGAASDVMLVNLSVEAAAGSESAAGAGNLVNLVHCQDWELRNVWLGTSHYHALEIDESDNIRLFGCRFYGAHDYASSGSYIQCDNGDASGRSIIPTGSGVSRFLCEDTVFVGRPDTDTSARDIDLKHAAILLDDIKFRRCRFVGRGLTGTAIIGFDAATGLTGLNGFEVSDCHFELNHAGSFAIYCPHQVSGPISGFVVRDTEISCPHGIVTALFLGDGGSRNTNANQSNRRGLVLRDITVRVDVTDYAVATPYSVIKVGCWEDAEVSRNTIYLTGTFAGGTGSGGGPSELILCHNVLSLDMSDNRAIISANNIAAASLRTAFTVWQINADDAGTTRKLRVVNNECWNTGGTWNAGTYVNRSLTSIPAGSTTEISGNNGSGVSAVLTIGGLRGAGSPTASFTVAQAALLTPDAGSTIFVSNESGGAVLAFGDGTNFRRVTDRAIIS